MIRKGRLLHGLNEKCPKCSDTDYIQIEGNPYCLGCGYEGKK